MILGVYWYFGFPTGLYNFDYFEFRQGYGGHMDNPAQLIAKVTTQDPDKLLELLKSLIEKYPDGNLFIYQDSNNLQIGTGGHQLYDYDFQLIKEVESIFKSENLKINHELKFENAQLIGFFNENKKGQITYPKKVFLQVVGSSLRKNNAETLALRMDCNLSLENKRSFISELSELSKSANINVFYYFDHDFLDRTNLMLFFTNGRQGLDFQEKQYSDIASFENTIEKLLNEYDVQLGHENGYGLYPENGPKIENIVDKEFII